MLTSISNIVSKVKSFNPPVVGIVTMIVAIVSFTAGAYLMYQLTEAKLAKKDLDISELKRHNAQEKSMQAQAALHDLTLATTKIKDAATNYARAETQIETRITELTNELQVFKPLPTTCRPDADRVRNLETVIDSANKAITGQ